MNVEVMSRQGWALILTVFIAALSVGTGAAAGLEETPNTGPPRFSLKLGGGLGFLPCRGGDLDLLRNHMEYEYTSRSPSVRAEFDWDPLSWGYDIPMELVIRLKPYLGIGLGTGIFTSAVQASYTKDYQYTWAGSDWSMTDDDHYETARDFKIRLIPVRINLYLFYPLGSITVYSYGGLGYYWGKLTQSASFSTELMHEYHDSSGYSSKEEDYDERTIEESARRGGLGFQGGLGVEFTLMRNFSIGLEVFGQHFNNLGWQGSSTTDYTTTTKYWTSREGWRPDDTASGSLEDTGTLWYQHDGSANHDIYVGDERNPPLFSAKREARIDLSAVGIRLTLRIHFGRPI
jgi:opacity protein-like surface antigen